MITKNEKEIWRPGLNQLQGVENQTICGTAFLSLCVIYLIFSNHCQDANI